MKKVYFAFGIHNHQPIGNFDFVFEDAYQKSYKPFIEVLHRFPDIRASIHFSGILIDWIENHHPELFSVIKEMIGRGQLELMSGAYYEPILPSIPVCDQIAQIEKLSGRLQKLFGVKPRGMWLAERVWEPSLPAQIHKAGMKYTILDDTHFKYTGLEEKDLHGYYITEDDGYSLALFPISKDLRYTIPFQDPEVTLEILRRLVNEDDENRLLVFADDGEKFGVWPQTYQHVYENKWLERFFSLLVENLDWIEIIHFSEALDLLPPAGRIYLPTASYAEMSEWTLLPHAIHKYKDFQKRLQDLQLWDEYGIFVRGGFWRNFLSKYPEVNFMHKKMLRFSKIINQHFKDEKKALDHIWAAQCNCPYWHGVFGGVYLSHLRQAIYENIIRAEKIIDKKRTLPVLETTDMDCDGQEEILVETAVHDLYWKPNSGAILFEHDIKAADKNILDTLSRREEASHKELQRAVFIGDYEKNKKAESIHDLVLSKEPDLIHHLRYDHYLKKSLIDHFFMEDGDLAGYARGDIAEIGDFVTARYLFEQKKQSHNQTKIFFKREGLLRVDEITLPLLLHKRVTIENSRPDYYVHYELIPGSEEKLTCIFAVEFNYGLQAGMAEDRFYYGENGKLDDYYLNSTGILKPAKMIGLRDEFYRIDIRLESECSDEIWRVPVESISLSESGFERVYQSSTVLLVHRVRFAGQAINIKIRQKIESF